MPRMPNNEDGHVLNATLLIYNADTWTDAGRKEFAKWLREKAKVVTRQGKEFGPRVKMQRWSVDEFRQGEVEVNEDGITNQRDFAKKPRAKKLDLKATPRVAKEGRVKAGPRKNKIMAALQEAASSKSIRLKKFAVAPYAAGQRLKAKRAGG